MPSAPRGPASSRRPTMAEVAAKAGVSRTLVSFILDGKPGASEETRQRVLAIAKEVGYRPDAAARLLALGRSRTLGVLTDVRQLFQAELVTGIYPAAEQLGYEVLLTTNLSDRPESVPIDALISHRCGSLILLAPTSGHDYLIKLAAEVPVVVVGPRLPAEVLGAGVDLASVRTDDARGIGDAVDYLVTLGHKDILHVDGGDGSGSPERRRGYREAMSAHGLEERIDIIAGDHTEEAGAAAARELLARPGLPTAVLASNDRSALGLLDVLTRSGVDIPGELSLVGFDDTRLSDFPRIDLTTVHQDAPGLAQHAVRLAVELLERRCSGPKEVVLRSQLVIRGTSGPPPATVRR
ncbi:LacI family DNA-binding transcriptional regulator [Mycolicibacterium cosmeticum]|uniref:Periplasmic binding protein/LacI transcriptional regulator n=1 Tax=Mycolicibacterium cosmeticum TaxID=258533 RepID=W9B6T8_MYCCO|nr:LacI family DNA-binding transcriptional regulator [Mycolicibacterium cosmeticum]CDO10431.1 periplasmic binding protein/LacI transcriptional regulator [Mycolicibacterium cosmeticum]